jgi:hypothetical protein
LLFSFVESIYEFFLLLIRGLPNRRLGFLGLLSLSSFDFSLDAFVDSLGNSFLGLFRLLCFGSIVDSFLQILRVINLLLGITMLNLLSGLNFLKVASSLIPLLFRGFNIIRLGEFMGFGFWKELFMGLNLVKSDC